MPASLGSPKGTTPQPPAWGARPLSGRPAWVSRPPGGAGCGPAAGERKAGTCATGARLAHPGPPGNAPPPALTEDQNVLAGRQLGPRAGGHLAQDRGPTGTTAQRSVPGPAWTSPAPEGSSVCPTVRPSPAGSAPGRALPGPADPARPSRRLTTGSGPPLPHWSGRRRPPPRARWGPAAPSSPPPPAPSCQLQPQRGPSPGPAEDPRGPRPGRPPPPPPSPRLTSPAQQIRVAGWAPSGTRCPPALTVPRPLRW